jgi:hypothetical protein
VVKLAVWVAGRNSYREAEETLSRVGRIFMSANRIWHYTNQWAVRLCQKQEQERAQENAVPSRDEPQPGEVKHDTPMGISIDGWMVNIIGEGWKEVKSGTIYEVVMGKGEDELTGEVVELAQAKACTYIGHLGGPEEFGQKLWVEAVQRRVPAAYEKVCVSDAAHWIWNLCQDYFPEAEQIVDWYHATEHLHKAAHLLHGEGTDKTRRWVNGMKTELYQGHAARIAIWLEEDAEQLSDDHANKLHSEATFFRNHQRRMQYLECREDGWPIGSGSIESGCKQFQMRLKGPGMRWSRPGAERMLALRASIMSNYFDLHWEALANSPPN